MKIYQQALFPLNKLSLVEKSEPESANKGTVEPTFFPNSAKLLLLALELKRGGCKTNISTNTIASDLDFHQSKETDSGLKTETN